MFGGEEEAVEVYYGSKISRESSLIAAKHATRGENRAVYHSSNLQSRGRNHHIFRSNDPVFAVELQLLTEARELHDALEPISFAESR